MFESFSGPLDLVRSAFSTTDEVGIEEITEIMDSIVYQSVSDGRITVVLDKQIVRCSLFQISKLYLAYFEKFQVPISFDYGEQAILVTEGLVIPKTASFVTLSVLGFFDCSVTFRYASDVDIEVFYPLLCVGFEAPTENARMRHDFEEFVKKREFPVRQLKGVVKKRMALESRNRDCLLQISKARKSLNERYEEATKILEKKARQASILLEKLDDICSECEEGAPKKLENIEATIGTIDGEIGEMEQAVHELSPLLEEKEEGRKMTRTEELKMLQIMKSRISDLRKQIETLKDA